MTTKSMNAGASTGRRPRMRNCLATMRIALALSPLHEDISAKSMDAAPAPGLAIRNDVRLG